jgi:cobalamin biosynthetic protein CobC
LTAVFHGGDLSKASAHFGEPPGGWVDLSTGINPRPWPVAPAMLDGLHALPDDARLNSLLDAAAAAYGTGASDRIVAAPGTQALIQWLPRLRPAGRTAIVSPTYGEHAAAWHLAGHDVVEVGDLPDAAGFDAVGFDVVVVTRPNNPDGRSPDAEDIAALAGNMASKGGLLVVDEAFADLDPGVSVAAQATTGLIALRSFGKFYGLAGLRLGFAVCDPVTAGSVAAALGPWPVSSLAADVGAAALADHPWQDATRSWLADSARRLDSILMGAGFEIVGGTDLYRLASRKDAMELYEQLGRAGIYVRRFPENPSWLRFGLPGTEEHWTRLERAMQP